jgi:GNAT superfamily N-acetyltransferase
MDKLQLRRMQLDDILQFRHEIIRPMQRPEDIVYFGDRVRSSLHVGAFLEDNLVGVVSVVREPCPSIADQNTWRARALGVRPEMRRTGLGRRLMQVTFGYAASQHASIVWGHARTKIIQLHLSVGMEKWGEEFHDPLTGPHYLVIRHIRPDDIHFLTPVDCS